MTLVSGRQRRAHGLLEPLTLATPLNAAPISPPIRARIAFATAVAATSHMQTILAERPVPCTLGERSS